MRLNLLLFGCFFFFKWLPFLGFNQFRYDFYTHATRSNFYYTLGLRHSSMRWIDVVQLQWHIIFFTFCDLYCSYNHQHFFCFVLNRTLKPILRHHQASMCPSQFFFISTVTSSAIFHQPFTNFSVKFLLCLFRTFSVGSPNPQSAHSNRILLSNVRFVMQTFRFTFIFRFDFVFFP